MNDRSKISEKKASRKESEAVKKLDSLILFAGISGAGRSTAIDAAADLGFYTVENLPVNLLQALLESVPERVKRIALSLNLDTDEKLDLFERQLESIGYPRPNISICFLNCDLPSVIKRYSQTRRPHPQFNPALDATLEDTVAREREQLHPLMERATKTIDSSGMSPHQLRSEIILFLEGLKSSDAPLSRVNLVSFGFKYGIPLDCDLLFDLRFISNPYFVDELKEKTGLNDEVKEYLDRDEAFHSVLDKYADLLLCLIPKYFDSGKRYVNIAIGCTGGRHRSVVAVERLKQMLIKSLDGSSVLIDARHRDISL